MNCTFWETQANGERASCTEQAVVRQGLRCLNGCWGEGAFDYACPGHQRFLNQERVCMGCQKVDLQLFPVQELVP